MTVYVQRDGAGAIIGVYSNPQPGYAEEAIDDSDPGVVAYRAALASAPTTAQNRSSAQSLFQSQTNSGDVERAAALVVLDRVNELRDWLTSFKAAVAAATNLANLQTRVAALPNLPDFTASQIKTAIANKIASGDAD